MTIGVDDARHGMVLPSQRFGQEALCCGRVLPGREEKVEFQQLLQMMASETYARFVQIFAG